MSIARIVCTACILARLGGSVPGQTVSGSLIGTLADQTVAVVRGVQIELTPHILNVQAVPDIENRTSYIAREPHVGRCLCNGSGESATAAAKPKPNEAN